MATTSFDTAGKLNLVFRKNRDGEKVFVFTDSNNADYDISAFDFQLKIKRKSISTTNILLLTIGDGLTKSGNELTITVDQDDTNQPNDFYYWELYNVTTDETWVDGNSYFVTSSTEPESEVSVTINLESETVTLVIQNSSVAGSGSQYRGAFDPTVANLLPSSGGSGTGGAVMAGDEWILTSGATYGGLFYGPDTIVKAKVNSPGQTANNWRYI